MADGSLNELKANCERWWLPRPHPLAMYSKLKPAIFEFKARAACLLTASAAAAVSCCLPCLVQPASKPDNTENVYTEFRYWGGYYWRIMFKKVERQFGGVCYAISSLR